jgi:hypothetical protein
MIHREQSIKKPGLNLRIRKPATSPSLSIKGKTEIKASQTPWALPSIGKRDLRQSQKIEMLCYHRKAIFTPCGHSIWLGAAGQCICSEGGEPTSHAFQTFLIDRFCWHCEVARRERLNKEGFKEIL